MLPDPQFSTEDYPNSLKATFDYLLDNAEAKNIQYVLSVGDMTNDNTEAQWENIKAQTERLNGKLPYTAIRGNHDVYYNNSVEFFDQYYADPSGYYYQHVRENGGFYDTSSVKNTYLLFEVGNVKYLLLNLDFGADDNVLAWADGILSQYADRRVIAITHAYMDADGTTLDDYDSGSPSTNAYKGDLGWNSGEDMWNELFKKHANVQMVICGHIQQDDVVLRTRKGDAGNIVYQLLIDTQTSDKMIKGGGFVAMLYFTEDGNNVRVECYSTVQEKYFRSTSNTISFTVGSEYEPQPLPELPPIKEASLTYGNETTYYASLQEAIDAANAGNGGTIKLLTNVDYGTCTTGVSFAHDTTIDGQGRYKIKATVGKEFFQPAAGVTLKLKDLDLIVTSTTANKYWNAVYVNTSNATVIIEGCTIQSTNDNPIKVQSGAAGSNIQIKGSTVIGHYLGIYMNNAPCKVEIENSTIIDRLSAVYVSGTSSTPDITIKNSTLTSGGYNGSTAAYGALTIKKGNANVTLGAGAVIDSTAIDSTLAQKYGIDADDCTGAPYGVWFYNGGAPALTLTGDVTLSGEEADLYLQVGTVDFVDYTGIQIIRLSGTAYYFYDTVDAAFTAKQDGDSIFSYAASSVQNKGYVTQTATDANSTTYYKVVGLDTSLIDNAIANANSKKDGIAQAEKPCEAGVGNKYVSAAQMQALNQAIAVAEAKKASATTGGAVIEAVQALNDALASFETAILTGVAHKDDGRDHVCDYGCDVYQGVHADSANDNDHDCEYCGERLNDCTPNEDDGDCTTAITCSVCGEITTAAKAAHTPGEDDGDCTTAITCTECGTVTTAAKAAHTPAEDDGDCTTAITCTECGTVTTAAKATHTGGTATCTAKAACSICGKAYGELTQHTYDSETDASCNVCGAERAVENQTNGNENTANGSENNAQNGNTEAPEKQGLSGGAVAGIVIGVVAVLGGGGFALFWFVIKKKKV